jgi:hypothetical protein
VRKGAPVEEWTVKISADVFRAFKLAAFLVLMVFAYMLMDHAGKIKESKEEKLRRLCRAWTQEVNFLSLIKCFQIETDHLTITI